MGGGAAQGAAGTLGAAGSNTSGPAEQRRPACPSLTPPDGAALGQARLRDEAREAEKEAETYRNRANAGSTVARSLERQLEGDAARWRAQALDADRLLLNVQTRQQRIEVRLAALRSGGGGGGAYRSGGGGRGGTGSGSRGGSGPARRRSLPSVEDELQRMKREMGK